MFETICLTLFCRGGRRRQPWWSILYSIFLHRLFWHTRWLICTNLHILSSRFISYVLLLASIHLIVKICHIFSAHISSLPRLPIWGISWNMFNEHFGDSMQSETQIKFHRSRPFKVQQRMIESNAGLKFNIWISESLIMKKKILKTSFFTNHFCELGSIIDQLLEKTSCLSIERFYRKENPDFHRRENLDFHAHSRSLAQSFKSFFRKWRELLPLRSMPGNSLYINKDDWENIRAWNQGDILTSLNKNKNNSSIDKYEFSQLCLFE